MRVWDARIKKSIASVNTKGILIEYCSSLFVVVLCFCCTVIVLKRCRRKYQHNMVA